MIAETLRTNLMTLANAYASATGGTLSAVSKRFYGHNLFFDHFKTGDMSISIDKYGAVVEKMREQWPKDAPWPRLRRASIRAPRRRHINGGKK